MVVEMPLSSFTADTKDEPFMYPQEDKSSRKGVTRITLIFL